MEPFNLTRQLGLFQFMFQLIQISFDPKRSSAKPEVEEWDENESRI